MRTVRDLPTLGEIPITLGTDGDYHAKITLGVKPNGKPDRRHRQGKTVAAVRAKLRELLREVDAGRKPRAGRAPTVAEWFDTWLTDIAPIGARALAPRTLDDYRSCLTTWIGPHLGHLRLDDLEAEHLQAMYAAMYRSTVKRTGAPVTPARVQKVHAVVRRGLEIAVRWHKVTRNVARQMDPPGYGEAAREALTVDEVGQVLRAAVAYAGPVPRVRWQLGMAVGARQCECLGLRWADLDLDAGLVSIQWQLQRRPWRHGCKPACGRKRAAECPARHLDLRRGEVAMAGALVLCRPKGWRRRPRPRVVSLPAPVVAELRRHRAEQAARRLAAGSWWHDHDLVLARPDGRPVDPRVDYREWQRVLTAAGLPPARVHVMRHTTATVLRDLGEAIEAIQEVLGHADLRTTRGYQHVTPGMTRGAADRMAGVVELVDLDERRARKVAGHER